MSFIAYFALAGALLCFCFCFCFFFHFRRDAASTIVGFSLESLALICPATRPGVEGIR